MDHFAPVAMAKKIQRIAGWTVEKNSNLDAPKILKIKLYHLSSVLPDTSLLTDHTKNVC